MAYMTKIKWYMHQTKNTGCRVPVWRISRFCGYGDSVGIPTGFSVGMEWVWALKFNPHGSPAKFAWVALYTHGSLTSLTS